MIHIELFVRQLLMKIIMNKNQKILKKMKKISFLSKKLMLEQLLVMVPIYGNINDTQVQKKVSLRNQQNLLKDEKVND